MLLTNSKIRVEAKVLFCPIHSVGGDQAMVIANILEGLSVSIRQYLKGVYLYEKLYVFKENRSKMARRMAKNRYI